MDLREALEKEMKYLKKLEVDSLRMAEKEGDIHQGMGYRSGLRVMIRSYERILVSLKGETT